MRTLLTFFGTLFVVTTLAQGTISDDLVGIWQMTRGTGGDYKNPVTGESFSMSLGYSVLLKIKANGTYVMQFYASGESRNCPYVDYSETSLGTLRVEGGQLVLQPAQHILELEDCISPGQHDLGTEATVYTMNLREDIDENGLRGMKLRLEGGAMPFDLELLHREPLMPGFQPAQPSGFVLGNNLYSETFGLWTPYPESDVEFYNPESGEFILPENDGTEDSYLRLNEQGYEMVRFWGNYNDNNHISNYFEDVCKKDYIYYERGIPYFSITEPPQFQGAVVTGHAQFEATDARLIVNIRNCDDDTGTLRYNLVPLVSYYQWTYFPATPDDIISTPENFSIECAWEKSEWQFMFCDGDFYSGRKYERRQ